MLCLVPALVLMLARCAAQEYSLPSHLNTVGLSADSPVTPHSEPALPNMVETLRRELMYNNYDYKHIQEAPSTGLFAADGTARAVPMPTRTAPPPLTTEATSAHPPSPDALYVRASQYPQNELNLFNTAPDEQYTQYQMYESTMVPSQYGVPDGASSMSPQLQLSSAVGGPPRLPPLQGLELYSQSWEHEELGGLTSTEQIKQELNRDLVYYVNDDRLKSGVNFRRYNDEHVHEKGEPYNSEERMKAPPPGLVQTTKKKHHRKRHRHMQREDLYVGRRANKRRGLGRAARRGTRHRPAAHDRSSVGHPRGQRHRLQNSVLRRRRPRLPYRYAPGHRHRRARLNQMRRGFRKQMPANNEDIGAQLIVPAGQGYNAVLYNRTEKSVDRVHELEPQFKKYKRDSLSDEDNDHQHVREHNAPHYEEQYVQLTTKEPNEHHYNDLEVNDSDDHTNSKQVNTIADGRRDYEHDVMPQNFTELTYDSQQSTTQSNVSTVELTKTTYKYKLLQARHPRGGRRSGGGAQVVEERGAAGVRLVPLGGARFPQFRLPRARRQYMHQRAAAQDPLAALLPRRAAR